MERVVDLKIPNCIELKGVNLIKLYHDDGFDDIKLSQIVDFAVDTVRDNCLRISVDTTDTYQYGQSGVKNENFDVYFVTFDDEFAEPRSELLWTLSSLFELKLLERQQTLNYVKSLGKTKTPISEVKTTERLTKTNKKLLLL